MRFIFISILWCIAGDTNFRSHGLQYIDEIYELPPGRISLLFTVESVDIAHLAASNKRLFTVQFKVNPSWEYICMYISSHFYNLFYLTFYCYSLSTIFPSYIHFLTLLFTVYVYVCQSIHSCSALSSGNSLWGLAIPESRVLSLYTISTLHLPYLSFMHNSFLSRNHTATLFFLFDLQ